jgi:mannitol-specific phosphotransferase system IIBC component
MAKALPLFGLMTATSLDVVFFLGSINRSVLFPFVACLPWVKTWTFWSGNSGASGVVLLLGGVVLEDYARSVYAVSVVATKVGA